MSLFGSYLREIFVFGNAGFIRAGGFQAFIQKFGFSGFALGYRRLPRSRRREQYRRIRRNGSRPLAFPWKRLICIFLVPFVFQDNIVQVDEFVDMT